MRLRTISCVTVSIFLATAGVRSTGRAGEHPESRNYATERPEIVKKLQDAYDEWAKDVFSIYAP